MKVFKHVSEQSKLIVHFVSIFHIILIQYLDENFSNFDLNSTKSEMNSLIDSLSMEYLLKASTTISAFLNKSCDTSAPR